MSLKKLMNVLKPATASAITCKKNFASPALLNNSIFTSYCYITLYYTIRMSKKRATKSRKLCKIPKISKAPTAMIKELIAVF